jgi:hypothetical protein
MSRFKDLVVGDVFEFDHSGLRFHGDLAHGPYVKTGPRRYALFDENAERGRLTGPDLRVGSVYVPVCRGESCGAEGR